MPTSNIDKAGTLLVAVISLPAISIGLWRLRELRRIAWLKSRISRQTTFDAARPDWFGG
jgi:hypothetical protein